MLTSVPGAVDSGGGRRLGSFEEMCAWWLRDRSSLLWRIVYSYYPPYPFSYEDLAQSGVEALLRALPRYDPLRTAFSTFATWQIRCGITHEIRRSTWRKTARDT